ncbi:MAG: DUF599 family protein [Boseongicola sp.]|nr:MAG: DUF599 family protein [Boseongicola sp.]
MTIFDRLALFTSLDIAAALFLGACWLIIGWVIENPPAARPSTSVLMDQYRKEWMVEALNRDVRIFDAQIIASLRQGTAFFATTSLFALGAVLALIGNTDPLQGVAQELTAQEVPIIVWQMKLIVVVLFLTHAFLRFAWSNRMYAYASVMLAAIPNDPNASLRSRQAGELNKRSTLNFNRGLRSIYFALGTIAWLLGPVPLFITTLLTVAFMLEREFMSGARRALLESEMANDPD